MGVRFPPRAPKFDMNTQQAQHLQLASLFLNKIYETYHDQGLMSVYLWGSILREEYNADSSDIDSVGIVTDSFPLTAQDAMNEQLKESKSGLRDLRINLVRLSEINGATPITRLATVIPPSLLLLEFDTWRCVAGRQFARSDFAAPIMSAIEAMCLNLKVVSDQYVPKIRSGDMAKWKSFVKQMMHVCHLMNKKKDNIVTPFSYVSLEREAISENLGMIELLLRIKKENYRLPTPQELDELFSFVGETQATYCKMNV